MYSDPQKGATPAMVEMLDKALTSWADLVEVKTGIHLHDKAGAACGIGSAFQAFFNAETKRGVDIVMEYTKLGEKLYDADCVFTGEDLIDYLTASEKTPMGVAQEAKKHGIPVFVLAGSIGTGIEALYDHGITSVHSLVKAPIPLKEAMERGAEFLEFSAEQVMRTFLAANSFGYCVFGRQQM